MRTIAGGWHGFIVQFGGGGGAGVVTAVAKVGEGVVVARFHRVVCVCVCVCVKRGGAGGCARLRRLLHPPTPKEL